MAFVLDTSVALSWVMPDEQTGKTDFLLDQLQEDTAFVPAIWPLETGNALCNALRRGRITETVAWHLADKLLAMPVQVVSMDQEKSLKAPLKAALLHNISTYDASYFELAQRRQLPLATLDKRLRETCMQLNIPVLPEHV